MLYNWRCEDCGTLVEVSRKMADIDIPPDSCSICTNTEFHRREIIRDNLKVKQFILLGDKHWHDKEYSPTRSIR